ncbi:MAG: hypothetical protein WCC58_03765 [Burkholderiales bacterium]
MFKPYLLIIALPIAAIAAPSAHAASDAEIGKIRDEIRELKDSYDSRIKALEQRLKEAEAKPAPATPAVRSGTGNAFNPAMSLILSGVYRNLSQDPATYRIGGFMPAGGESGPGGRGLSLAESELTLSANIDPFFFGQFTMAVSAEDTVSVEEAFINSTTLGNGLNLKLGRFYSGLGYLNDQHAHAWDFVDNPLVYSAFLGRQYTHDGLQLKWLVPSENFMEFGAEIGNGARFPGTALNKNGVNAATLYVHSGGDVNESHSWRAGVSFLRTRADDRSFDDSLQGASVPFAFSGSSNLAAADFVWKWAPNGNSKETNFKLQAEYMRRKESGTLSYSAPQPQIPANSVNGPYASNQSGWYVQGIYQFMPRWRAGLRYDRLSAGRQAPPTGGIADASFLADYRPSRSTLMFDFNASEFSRFRLQLAQDKSRPDATDNQFTLQFINSLGAHGAHKY